eukprot:gene12537-15946_t
MATGDIELAQLQDAAKSRGLGLWAYVTEVAQTDDDTSPAQDGSGASTLIPVRVCEIVDGCTFYVQRRDEQGTRDMAVVQDTMAAFSTECHPNPLSASDLKKGLKCAALFHEPVTDTVAVGSSRPETVPRWFRVRVESVI